LIETDTTLKLTHISVYGKLRWLQYLKTFVNSKMRNMLKKEKMQSKLRKIKLCRNRKIFTGIYRTRQTHEAKLAQCISWILVKIVIYVAEKCLQYFHKYCLLCSIMIIFYVWIFIFYVTTVSLIFTCTV
jgi:hypothetical protein